MIRPVIWSRGIGALVVIALCLSAALAIVTNERTKARVHGIEVFAASEER